MKVQQVNTFWYENGNTGYMRFQITVRFIDGKTYHEMFSTGLYKSCYDDTPLVDIEALLDGELTEQGYNKFSNLIQQDWWKEAVNLHDNLLIAEKFEFITNLKEKLQDFNKDF